MCNSEWNEKVKVFHRGLGLGIKLELGLGLGFMDKARAFLGSL